MKRFLNYIYIIIISQLILVSCEDGGIGNFNIFPVSDDIKLGTQVDTEIKKDTKEYPLYSDSYVQNYLNSIMNQILASPEIKHKNDFTYTIQVIKRDDVINAFATPGGYVYVYTGLMKFVGNKAELASVIAHEIAHCERRHATNRMTKQYGLSVLSSIILGDNPSQLAQITANLFSTAGLLVNSREDEYEADEYAFKYLRSTPYYAGAMTYFFNRISAGKEQNPSTFEKLLSTHPMPADRIKAVEDMVRDNNIPAATEASIMENDYKVFKSKLP